MSSSTPDSKVLAGAANESPSATTPRQHHHRHRRHEALAMSPDATNRTRSTSNSNNNNGDANETPLVENIDGSVTSNHTRNLRSRRSTQVNRTGAAFSLLGDDVRNGLTICCDGVSVQRHHRNVIDEFSCLFRGGRVTAVVNCCGTNSALVLLAALAGRVDCAAGNIVMNGVPVSASTYQAQMSFVEEKDSLTGGGGVTSDLLVELTVRENLEYASRLRVANSAQAYSVDEMLQQLLLAPHADARIRDCNLYVRRRVALGKELLLNPSVLLLDEPVDGLATHEAQQFLTILLKLAAPSAADAEARHVMREAMVTSAAASISGSAADGAAATTIEGLSSPPRVSLYTPRHGRLHLRDNQGSESGLSPMPSTTFVPLSSSAVSPLPNNSNNSNKSNTHHGGAGHSVHTPLSDETQRVVIFSIVQPRWALLQYVHDVVLLERSRCIFAGSVEEMFSVKLPKAALRPPTTTGGSSSEHRVGELRERGDDENDLNNNEGGDQLMRSTTQIALESTLTEEAPADSYDAVAASIRKTRLNEEFLHGLYRLATSAVGAAASAGGIVTGTDFPEFGSFTENVNLSESCTLQSPAGVAVRADDNYATPLSQLYSVKFGHTRAQVTAYMEVCAAGLLSLPEASHQAPSGFIQLLYLFRFGFVEVKHNLLVDLAALNLMLAVAAALAAVYGVQVGERGIQNCAGILFFLVCLVVLQAVLSLDAQRREYAAFYRYSSNGYYAAWTFLVFRAVTAALWRLGLTSFVALVVFTLSNFGEPWREYRAIFELGFIMAVLSYCCYFLIWFLCSWWPSDRVSRFIVFTFYTFNIVLAGLVLNLATLPTVVRGVSFLSVMRLAYESSILTHFADKTFDCVKQNSTNPTATPGDDGVSSGAKAISQTLRRSTATDTFSSTVSKAVMIKSAKARDSFSQSNKGRHATLIQVASTPVQRAATTTWATSTMTVSSVQASLQGVPCYTGADYVTFMGFSASHRWTNVGILAGMSVVLLLASWVMMVLYRPRRRLKVNV